MSFFPRNDDAWCREAIAETARKATFEYMNMCRKLVAQASVELMDVVRRLKGGFKGFKGGFKGRKGKGFEA